jgi:hypothetical protein
LPEKGDERAPLAGRREVDVAGEHQGPHVVGLDRENPHIAVKKQTPMSGRGHNIAMRKSEKMETGRGRREWAEGEMESARSAWPPSHADGRCGGGLGFARFSFLSHR